MGYWTAYTELGFGGVKVPFFSDAGTLLFDPLVLVASLLLPALALASFAAARAPPLRAVPARADARRGVRDDGRVPRGFAAAPGDHRRLRERRGGPVPAHDLQGGAADDVRHRRPARTGRGAGVDLAAEQSHEPPCCAGHRPRRRRSARVGVARLRRVAVLPGPRGRSRRRVHGPGRLVAGCRRRRPHAARRHPHRGAARQPVRLLRLGWRHRPRLSRRSATGRPPRASSCPTRTCARSTCSGPSTASSRSSAPCPASCRRCST